MAQEPIRLEERLEVEAVALRLLEGALELILRPSEAPVNKHSRGIPVDGPADHVEDDMAGNEPCQHEQTKADIARI